MPATETLNQRAYDRQQSREKICAQWLKTSARTVRTPILSAVLAGVGNGIGVIVQAALTAYLLQALIIDRLALQALTLPLGALLSIFAFRSLCVYVQQSAGFNAGAAIKRHVRSALTDKLAALGPAYLKRQRSGELAALAVEQTEALENYIARYLPQRSIATVLPVLMIAVVFPVNWMVGIIFLVTGPMIPVFMILIGMGAASAQRSQFLALSRMGGYFLDRLQGLPTLRLFGQAEHEAHTIADIADDFRRKTMAVLRLAFLSSAVLEFFSAVAVALVAVYVGLGLLGFVNFGPAAGIELSDALFALLLAPEFFMPLRQLAIHYHDRAEALAATDNLLQLFEQTGGETVRESTAVAGDPLIVFRKVSKDYGKRRALDNLDLYIAAGEKIALVGESGAGKTTLLNLLLGFERAESGDLILAGRNVTRDHASRYCAWVGQRPYIFPASIRANIALAEPSASEQAITQAADAAGVTDFLTNLPNALDTVVGERGYGLSGGQVQRIALARAFLKAAPIVVLDEPTAHLDDMNKRYLLETITNLFQDNTLIIASHDPEVANRMDRHIRLHEGKILPCTI
ncbi:MAG: thiol reductant ABC exporter subunit CydD [Gammaproteobacteria bacterium]